MTDQIHLTSQRIDIWLWYARLCKTRSISNKLIKSGHVHINGHRIVKPATAVKKNDVITLPWHHQIKVIRVKNFTIQRSSARLCTILYEEILEK